LDENQNDDPAATAVEFRTIEVVPWIFFWLELDVSWKKRRWYFFGERDVLELG